MKQVFGLLIFVFGVAFANAQSLLKDSLVNLFMIKINYTVQIPFADMADRFGVNSALGLGIGGKFGKNILLGAEGSYIFSRNVNEPNVLAGIVDAEGFLIGSSGLYTDYSFSEKGFNILVNGGKMFAFRRPNKNSGIVALLGVGYMQHKISIDVEESEAPMLNKEYKKGYDRLSSGFMLSQFIGYSYLDAKRKRINIYFGIEFQEGFTKSRRSWNYDQNQKDDKSRKDILIGLRIGWIVPFYFAQTEKYYYY